MGVELILWDSSRPAPLNEGKVYTWNGYFQKNSVCSILRYIENNDEQLRKKYIEFIFDMGESTINGKRIIDIFTIEDNLSFWWLTPFVEKNPWKCPEIAEAIRFFALEEILLTQKPSSLKLVSENKNIHIIVHDLCKNLNIEYNYKLNSNDIDNIKYDKKQSHNKSRFILLKNIGEPIICDDISKDDILNII